MATFTTDMKASISQLDACKCGVCGGILKESKLLPCAHSFCKSCLKLERETGDQFACPVCGHLVDKPSGGIESLECNRFVETFLNILDFKQTTPFCQCCETKGISDVPASALCLDCSMHMCSSCHETHSTFPLFLKHKVVDVKNSSLFDNCHSYDKNVCASHPNRECEIFCITCQTRLCIECGLNESSPLSSVGKNHDCVKISDIVKQDTDKLKVSLDQIEGDLSNFTKHVDRVKANLVTLEKNHEVVKQTILEEKERIQKELEENTKKQLNVAAECFAQKRSALMESLKKLESHVNHQSVVREKWMCAQEFYPPVELHDASDKRMDKIKRKAPKVNLSYLPVTYEVAFTEASLCMGNVVEHVEFKGSTNYDVAHSSFTNQFYFACHSGMWMGDGETLRKVHDELSWCLCTSNDGRLLYGAALNPTKVNVFTLSHTQDPTLLRNFNIENCSSVFSISINSTGRMAVVDGLGKKIFVFKAFDNIDQVISTSVFSTGYPCYAVGIGDNQVCVTIRGDSSSQPCVMSIDTVRKCSLWKVEIPEDVCCASSVGDLLYVYVSRIPHTDSVIILTKEGVNIGTISRLGRKLVKVLGDNNTGKLTAVSVSPA